MKKIKQLEISSILILVILFGLGVFATLKTLISDYAESNSSGVTMMQSLKSSAASFSDDFEKNVPTAKFMNSVLYRVSGICNSDQVIIGKDGWLFYSSKTDGDPIADYEGTNHYTDEQLDTAKNNILETQKSLEDSGIQFCLIVPPNKERVYSDSMPLKYNFAQESRTDVLLNYLQQNGAYAVNPKDEIIKFSNDYKTYYKQDTHWDELGGYIGTKCALDTFNLSVPELDESIVEKDSKCNSDLVGIASLDGVFESDYGLTTSRTLHDIDDSKMDEKAPSHFHNDKAEFDKTVLLIGDSFRKSMVPNLAYCFKDVYVIHRDNYEKEMLDNIAPDYLISEFVERYSDNIGTFKIL